MTFEQWLLKQGVTLRPWQQTAADAFFGTLDCPPETYRGKTFLVEKMLEFVNEHGNEMTSADDVKTFVAVSVGERGWTVWNVETDTEATNPVATEEEAAFMAGNLNRIERGE